MKKILLLVLTSSVALLAVCKDNDKGYAEYLIIKGSNKEGRELLQSMIDFEAAHPENFESKVDLGNFYLVTQDFEQANHYLQSAESVVKNAANTKESKTLTGILYGSLASLRFAEKNLDEALKYAKLAAKYDSTKPEYDYLMAQILYVKGDNGNALKQFEAAYKKAPEKIESQNLTAMIKLYSDKGQFSKARDFLDLYYTKGTYYPGWGMIASKIYEETNSNGRSLLCAYIDIEHYSDIYDYGVNETQKEIKKIESELRQSGRYEDVKDDFALLCSLSDPAVNSQKAGSREYTGASGDDFFIRDYFIICGKINSGNCGLNDINQYLSYEPFFKNSCLYYLNVWKGLTQLDPGNKKDYIPVLERILTLDRGQSTDLAARTLIGNEIGLSKKEASNLLMPQELADVLYKYKDSRDTKELEKLYAFFELPDNYYVFEGMSQLKNTVDYFELRNVLSTKARSSGGKLKKRLDYVLR